MTSAGFFGFEVVGVNQSVDTMEGIAYRMANAKPAWEASAKNMESGEARLFERYHGKYVRTGATLRSLTEWHANDAIRDVHGDGQGLTFGTAVWYARFLKRKTPSGRTKSAVLQLLPKERRGIRDVYMAFVMGQPMPVVMQ